MVVGERYIERKWEGDSLIIVSSLHMLMTLHCVFPLFLSSTIECYNDKFTPVRFLVI